MITPAAVQNRDAAKSLIQSHITMYTNEVGVEMTSRQSEIPRPKCSGVIETLSEEEVKGKRSIVVRSPVRHATAISRPLGFRESPSAKTEKRRKAQAHHLGCE